MLATPVVTTTAQALDLREFALRQRVDSARVDWRVGRWALTGAKREELRGWARESRATHGHDILNQGCGPLEKRQQ
jgi:hypothetical protein